MSTRALAWGGTLVAVFVIACVGEDVVPVSSGGPEASSGSSGTSGGSSGTSSGSSGETTPTAPLAPTNAFATANVATGATVTWAAPVSDGGQAITEYTITSSPGGIVAKAGAHATSAVVTGLDVGASYTFTVTATNGIGTSPPATTNSVTIVDEPSPVLDSACPGEKGFVPFFAAVPGADRYNLYYATAPGVTLANGTKIANVKNGTPALGDVPPGTYYVAITSVKGGIESLPSNEVSVTVTPRSPLADTLFISRGIRVGEGGIDIITPASTVKSGAATKTLYGPSTGINGSTSALHADKATAMLYVHRGGAVPSVGVWHDAGGLADGDKAPSRILSGALTNLGPGGALVVDSTRNILYVAVNGSGPSEHRILAWKNACNVDGNVPPSATVKIATTSSFYLDLALDELHDRLYVASRSTSSTRVVFAVDGISTKDGSVAATKTFTIQGVPATTTDLDSVAYDATNDFLFIGSGTHEGGSVFRFNAPHGLPDGAIAPAVIAKGFWTTGTQRMAVSGGTLFILLGIDPTNIARYPSSQTLSSANPAGGPNLYMTTRTGIAGATTAFATGIAYVK